MICIQYLWCVPYIRTWNTQLVVELITASKGVYALHAMNLYLWLIVMATCHSWCAGERCPTLAFQVGDPANLDISQFGAYINTNNTPGKSRRTERGRTWNKTLCGAGLNASVLGSQVDLIIGGEVLPLHPDLVLPGDLSPLLIHMQLNATASHEVCNQPGLSITHVWWQYYSLQLYYLFNVWSMNTSIAPPGCPTKEGHLSPGENIGRGIAFAL